MRTIVFVLGILISGWGALQAQPGSTTEEEVQNQALFIEANQQKLLGNYEKAAQKYLSLLERIPENGAVAYELGRVYEAMNENTKALQYARQAWEKEKNSWYAIFLAEMEDKMNQPEKAAELFEELLKREPGNEFYYQKLGYFLVASQQADKAIKVYDELEEKVGVIEDLVRKKYNLYLGLGKEKKAESELKKLIEYYPTRTDYYHQLAYFYQQSDRKEDARAVFEQILQIAPDDSKARIALASENQADDSADRFSQIRPLFADPNLSLDEKIKTILPLVESLAQKNDPELARQLAELAATLTEQYPDNAKSHALMGDLHFYSNRRDLAIQEYEKALNLSGSVFTVWEQLLYLYLETGQYTALIDKAEESMDYFPNQPELYFLSALGAYYLGNYEDALPLLDQADFMAAQSPDLQLNIMAWKGSVLNRQGKTEQADQAFSEVLERSPDNPYFKIQYAYHLILRDDQSGKADELLGEVGSSLPAALHAKACLQYQKGSFEDARELFEQAIQQLEVPSPELLEQYGDTLFQLGNTDEAVRNWEKARDMGYRSSHLSRKITDKKLYD